MVREREFTNSTRLQEELTSDGWKTPDTYTNNFAEIPDASAVYLFMLYDNHSKSRALDYENAIIGYVGMARRLKRRLANHSVLAELRELEGLWAQRWFKRIVSAQLRETERLYIQRFDPPWNIIGRPRGLLQ
jgi:hypothetical protein